MRNWMNAVLGGALRVADTLDDWIAETVSGFGAAAPIVAETAGHVADTGMPGNVSANPPPGQRF